MRHDPFAPAIPAPAPAVAAPEPPPVKTAAKTKAPKDPKAAKPAPSPLGLDRVPDAALNYLRGAHAAAARLPEVAALRGQLATWCHSHPAITDWRVAFATWADAFIATPLPHRDSVIPSGAAGTESRLQPVPVCASPEPIAPPVVPVCPAPVAVVPPVAAEPPLMSPAAAAHLLQLLDQGKKILWTGHPKIAGLPTYHSLPDGQHHGHGYFSSSTDDWEVHFTAGGATSQAHGTRYTTINEKRGVFPYDLPAIRAVLESFLVTEPPLAVPEPTSPITIPVAPPEAEPTPVAIPILTSPGSFPPTPTQAHTLPVLTVTLTPDAPVPAPLPAPVRLTRAARSAGLRALLNGH